MNHKSITHNPNPPIFVSSSGRANKSLNADPESGVF